MTVFHKVVLALMITFFCASSYALEPNEILVIVNSQSGQSEFIADYYCQKRDVPKANIIRLSLGSNSVTTISRDDYNKKIAQPMRAIIKGDEFKGKIKCLLTTYGVPIVVSGRGQLAGEKDNLERIEQLIEQGKKMIEEYNEANSGAQIQTDAERQVIEQRITQLEIVVDIINGRETSASLDSELSMVLIENYELYRWQNNPLQRKSNESGSEVPASGPDSGVLMVSRLDGPSVSIITALIDKAISAEHNGLIGVAYFDARGMTGSDSYGIYDKDLRDLAEITKTNMDLPVVLENTSNLFSAGQCPDTAIYCGWYSLRKYVDAFDFADGAIGYHIASYEAAGLRDPNAPQWVPAMLADGITATLGPVEEPYLQSFPKPSEFFEELYKGSNLVEAYFHTNPMNSWRMLLIGDPLYTPFKKQSGTQIRPVN